MIHNTFIGHYVMREDDEMTKEEFDNLRDGDVVENKRTKARHVITPAKHAGEPLTQIKRTEIETRLKQFDIVMKVCDKL